MANQVFQCDGCPKTYPDESLADWCNAQHSLEGLADWLHKKLCHNNHADGCGYFYENWNNPGTTRKEWRKRAELLENFLAEFQIPDRYLKHDLLYIFRG